MRAHSTHRPVFGFANDLGSVGSDAVSTLYSIGMTQDGAINLLGEGSNLTTYPALWNSYFSSDVDAVSFFPCSVRKSGYPA